MDRLALCLLPCDSGLMVLNWFGGLGAGDCSHLGLLLSKRAWAGPGAHRGMVALSSLNHQSQWRALGKSIIINPIKIV